MKFFDLLNENDLVGLKIPEIQSLYQVLQTDLLDARQRINSRQDVNFVFNLLDNKIKQLLVNLEFDFKAKI